jgi:purine-binding chemotaxis protein CheW
VEILVYEIRGRRFGFPARKVSELIRAVALTALPEALAPIEGVIDVRGEVVPVVDIAERLGLAPRPMRASDHLILVSTRGGLVAVRADRAIDLVEAEVGESGDAVNDGDPAAAIARVADGLIVVHDPDRLVPEARVRRLGAIPAARAEGEGAR